MIFTKTKFCIFLHSKTNVGPTLTMRKILFAF